MGVPFSKRRDDKTANNEQEPRTLEDPSSGPYDDHAAWNEQEPRTMEPEPYDEHAPVHGVLDMSHEPTRWSPYASELKLEDRSARHVVRCGDHVAFFDPADADVVDGLFALLSVPERPSEKKTALVRLRTALAVLKGTPVSEACRLDKVAKMFHDALEVAGDTESVAAADLEACLASWVIEPTRYAPFPDLAGAVAFMHLPVRDNRVVGMALRHRYDPDPEPLPSTATRVTSTNLHIVPDPEIKFTRVSVWNEPSRATHDDNGRNLIMP